MKPHYPILDGLRGVAALAVVGFHVLEAHYPVFAQHPLHHGYLAVDFFFLLSGFVLGYAYDDQWDHLTTGTFLRRRLVRLHPLVVLGTLLGALGFLLDPYTAKPAVGGGLLLLGAVLLGLTLLPGPDVRGWGETHSLNGPAWSLLQEYLASLLYALVLRRLRPVALRILVALSAAALLTLALRRGDVATGWGYDSFGSAVVRMAYPFGAGLLLFRTGWRPRLPGAFPLTAALLLVLLALPYFRLNGLYEAAVIILAFPGLVAVGAGGQLGEAGARVCRGLGALSYPLYITHYLLIYAYSAWVATRKPAPALSSLVGGGLVIVALLLAYATLKLYDEPVRAWLTRRIKMGSERSR